jgi:hypothetical protein
MKHHYIYIGTFNESIKKSNKRLRKTCHSVAKINCTPLKLPRVTIKPNPTGGLTHFILYFLIYITNGNEGLKFAIWLKEKDFKKHGAENYQEFSFQQIAKISFNLWFNPHTKIDPNKIRRNKQPFIICKIFSIFPISISNQNLFTI